MPLFSVEAHKSRVADEVAGICLPTVPFTYIANSRVGIVSDVASVVGVIDYVVRVIFTAADDGRSRACDFLQFTYWGPFLSS